MINKTEIECRFRKSIESYEDNAYAQKLIVRHLVELLEYYFPRKSAKIFEIGCGTGLLTEEISKKWIDSVLIINDLVDEMCSKTANRCNLVTDCIPGDIERLNIPEKLDLIISTSTFQWLAQPEQTFARLSNSLQPQGYLIFSTFGEDNFREIRSITGQGLVYHSIQEIKAMLSPYYTIVHTETDHHVLEFDDPIDVLRHVKKTGVNATPAPYHWSKGRLANFRDEYSARFLTHGKYPLTYHPLYFICRVKEQGTSGFPTQQ